MNKMKKLLLSLLAGTACVSIFAFGGCFFDGNNEDDNQPDDSTEITNPDVPLGGSSCQHGEASHVEAVSAGCETAGNREYWFCVECGKYFSDEDCTVETSLAAVTLTKLGHSYGEFEYDYEAKQYVKVCENDHAHTVEQEAGTAEYPYLASNAEQFAELCGTDKFITLSADIDLRATETSDSTGFYSIKTDTVLDLNGYTLTTKKGFTVGIYNNPAAPVFTVKNGAINRVVDSGSTANKATVAAQGNGELEIVNCTITTNQDTAVTVWDSCKVTVTDSTLKGVAYGLSSNAGAGNYTEAISVKLTNCRIDAQGAGILWNIPASIEIDGCEIKSIGQAMIARGGDITVSNSTLIKRAFVEGVDWELLAKGDEEVYPQYENKNWGNGNAVPGYALVVGNRSSSYQYATNLTLNNVKVQVEEGVVAKYVYAYGNTNPDYGTTITYDADCELVEIVIGDKDAANGSNVTVIAPATV